MYQCTLRFHMCGRLMSLSKVFALIHDPPYGQHRHHLENEYLLVTAICASQAPQNIDIRIYKWDFHPLKSKLRFYRPIPKK